MSEPIDFNAERNKRERPDAEFVKRDGFGREMFLYALEYEFDGGTWVSEVWAYSMDEAERRVHSMRGSLTLKGQLFEAGFLA